MHHNSNTQCICSKELLLPEPNDNTATELPPEEQPLKPKEVRYARVARSSILFFFGVLLLLGVCWKMLHVLELVYVSALFAVVLMPVVQRLQKIRIRGWSPSRPVAIIGLVLVVVATLTLFFTFAFPPVIDDMKGFAADLPQRIPGLVAKLKKLPMADKFGVDAAAQRAEAALSSFAGYLFSSIPMWAEHILDLITAIVLTIYFMLEGEIAYLYFLSFFTAPHRERLAKTLILAENRVSKWLIGQGSLMLILGVCSTIAFGFLHVRYFVLLGVLMGLFNIIPVAGGVITIVLAAAAAALDSWAKMGGVLIFYAIYVQVENAYLTPKIMKSSVDLPGLAVLISLLIGTALAGIVGALVSVPTAALVAVLINEYLVQPDAGALLQEMDTEKVDANRVRA